MDLILLCNNYFVVPACNNYFAQMPNYAANINKSVIRYRSGVIIMLYTYSFMFSPTENITLWSPLRRSHVYWHVSFLHRFVKMIRSVILNKTDNGQLLFDILWSIFKVSLKLNIPQHRILINLRTVAHPIHRSLETS